MRISCSLTSVNLEYSVTCHRDGCECSLDCLLGLETWSLTLREERRLSVFESRVLRRIFGPTRDEVTGVWRKLHNEELNDVYSSPNIVRVIK